MRSPVAVAREAYRLRMTRGQRGRELARRELAFVAFLIVAAAFVWVARPGFMGGTAWWEDWLAPAGLIGVLIGLVWMIRIYRADPEPDQRAWRYRQWD
jgi:hypothetical protein